MIPGFNHNIKHKERMFHVQTEDSGPKNPHIITHLFMGGNILATTKTSYADLLLQEGYEKTVRKMMEDQHKKMLRSLVGGLYDPQFHGESPGLSKERPEAQQLAPASSSSPGQNLSTRTPAFGIASVGLAPPLPDAEITRPPPPAARAPPRSLSPSVPAPVVGVDPIPAPESVFGESMISQKSLDEVILSYLADMEKEEK